MARPRKSLPPGAREYLMACACDGSLQETKIAAALGMSYRAWKRVLKDNEDARLLWAEALATERDVIVQSVYAEARGGNIQAARLLLGARHGVRENNESASDTGRGGVTINLPGSMSAAQYAKLIQVDEPDALTNE